MKLNLSEEKINFFENFLIKKAPLTTSLKFNEGYEKFIAEFITHLRVDIVFLMTVPEAGLNINEMLDNSFLYLEIKYEDAESFLSDFWYGVEWAAHQAIEFFNLLVWEEISEMAN